MLHITTKQVFLDVTSCLTSTLVVTSHESNAGSVFVLQVFLHGTYKTWETTCISSIERKGHTHGKSAVFM